MPDLMSCGFLIYRKDPNPTFLLMRHANRWDLPKGHVDEGETEMECALRELEEETGISKSDIVIDQGFRFVQDYIVKQKRHGYAPKEKRLVIMLAELINEVEIVLTEHLGYEWVDWDPPHSIQEKTIDPVLAELGEYWEA